MLKILGRSGSINARKVLWTADELGLDYAREEWGLPARAPKVPEFLALNPNGLVPVLVEGDFVLWESHAIMRYLCGLPSAVRLIPAQPQPAALMDQWLIWQQTELTPSWSYAHRAARLVRGYDDPAKIAASLAQWTARMAMIEQRLGDDRPFIVGDEFTLADIALGVSVHRWFLTPVEKAELPLTGQYHRRLQARAAARSHLAETA